MRFIVLLLMLLPSVVSAQATKEDYAIYSQYLENYQKEKGRKIHFVVRESTDYLRKYDTAEINNIVVELRGFLNGDPVSVSDVKFMYKSFADALKKDTLWMPLLASLDKKTKSEFILEKKFSKNLHTVIISNNDLDTYFKKIKDFRKSWADFQNYYSKRAVLVEFSDAITDGKRAVFYFVSKCGSLCGQGYIVFCYKKKGHWEFIPTFPRWQS